jgi:protein-tyrosine-phosphatase
MANASSHGMTVPSPTRREAVLVLDADGRSGLACVQSLGPTGVDIHVAVRARGSSTERSRWCAFVHQEPPAEPSQAGADWLVALDRIHDFTLILPTTENSLRWLRRLPEDHPVRLKAILPADTAIDAALDKERTREIAGRLGLPVPRSRLLAQGEPAPQAEGFPRVLKPVHSKVVIGHRLVSLAVAVVRDAAARDATLAAWLPFTAVQEQVWVPGHGIGVEVLYERGKCAWHFVHERLHEWPLTGGASTLRRAAGAEASLVDLTCRLLDELGWHGVAMVEWRRDEEGNLHLMEINPRLWGSLPLTIAAGVDVPRGLLAMARGQSAPPAPRWRTGATARNLTEDLRWLLANARADHGDALLLTRPVWRSVLGLLRGLGLREAWDGWTWRDPAVAWAEVRALARRPFALIARGAGHQIALWRARRHHAAMFGPNGAVPKPVHSVLFICLGNICRSPFAEVAGCARLKPVHVESAGFHSNVNRQSPSHVVEAARTLGIDLSKWASRRVSKEQVGAADLIVAMDFANLRAIATEFPEALPRATLLGLFDPKGPAEIPDPYDMAPESTQLVLQRMLVALTALALQLQSGGPLG